MQHNFQHASFEVNDDEGQGRVDRSRDTKLSQEPQEDSEEKKDK